MEIVESIIKTTQEGDKTYKYEYMLTRGRISLNYIDEVMSLQSYGIEVERKDFIGDKLVNIERDSIKNISTDRYRVHNLLRILYENIVSPINFIEILGEYVDDYASDFDEAYKSISNC